MVYGKAIPLFLNGIAGEIERRVKDEYKGIQRITVFTEFFGPGSFAGQHIETDEMELRLLDAFIFKKGFMAPRAFVKLFGDLPCAPEVVYDGTLNKSFIDDVRSGRYPVVEGVVAKGDGFMVKIKTAAYFKKLNEVYGTEYRNYWE